MILNKVHYNSQEHLNILRFLLKNSKNINEIEGFANNQIPIKYTNCFLTKIPQLQRPKKYHRKFLFLRVQVGGGAVIFLLTLKICQYR